MKYAFTCKKVTLNDSIKEYAEKKINKLQRYFREEDTTAYVTFSVEKEHLSPFTVIIASIVTLPFLLALLSLIKKRIENELLTIV